MRGLVSFCLFGDDPSDIYYKGAMRNASIYCQYREDWDLWFYVGKSVPDSVLGEISSRNPRASFQFMDGPENQTSTWWRMQAIFHSQHDFIVFRDVDSRPCDRELTAVNEWLKSSYPYHAMRDHNFHGRPLLAGLWGIKKEAYYSLRNIPDFLSQNEDFYGIDQIALQMHVWPIARRQVMAHIGSYNIYEKMDQRRPFVERRPPNGFIAQGFTGNDKIRYPGHEEFVVSDHELRSRSDIFLEEYRTKSVTST